MVDMVQTALEDRAEAPSVRPGQQEEMAPMATWVAMAAMALEDREAPSVRPGQLEETRPPRPSCPRMPRPSKLKRSMRLQSMTEDVSLPRGLLPAAPHQDDSPGARQGLARDAPGTRQGRARDSPGESGEGEPAEELRATASARSRSRSPPRRMPCDRIDLSGFVNWTSAGGEAAVVEAACHRILQVNSDGGPSYIGVTMDAWERLHGMKEDQRHFPK